MAQASRRLKHARRLKRSNSLLTRQIKAERTQHFNAFSTLMMVLAQSGGEVTVTQGTMQQVLQGLSTLKWETAAGKVEGEVIVRVVSDGSILATELPAEPQEEPNVQPDNV